VGSQATARHGLVDVPLLVHVPPLLLVLRITPLSPTAMQLLVLRQATLYKLVVTVVLCVLQALPLFVVLRIAPPSPTA